MSTDALHVTLSDDTVAQDAGPIRELIDAVGSVVVGQEQMVRSLVIGMLTGGHVLLEGVPGLAKTLTVTTLAQGCHAEFSRIQFTPDLLPADVIGTLIYNPKDGSFTPRKGPIFANIVLADEINRAPAKVQSALLEAMQEKRATIGDTTYSVGDPFLVLATQNPIEQEGTYPLPEAQVDRFMLKLHVGYPTKDEERVIVDRMMSTAEHPGIKPVVNLEQIASARDTVNRVFVDEKIKDYIVSLVHATRTRCARSSIASSQLESGPAQARRVRCFAACIAGPGTRRASQRVPRRTGICHPIGHQDHRHGCAPPPRAGELRSRGRGHQQRRHRE